MKSIAVIGAGIAGLSAAYELEKKADERGLSIRIDLIERSARAGGNILTERIGGFLVEGGPDCVFSEKPQALSLCEELGLEGQLLRTNEQNKGTFVYVGGKLHPLPEGVMLMVPTMIKPMLLSGLISPLGKLRMGLELLVPKKTDGEDETLAKFVERRFGRELLDKIAEPLVAGIHAGDPRTMSIRSSFPRFVKLEQVHRSLIKGMWLKRKHMEGGRDGTPPKYTMFMTLKDGMQVMTNKLMKSLRLTIFRPNTEVKSISTGRDGYVISCASGSCGPYRAVVLATPSYAASAILREMAPELSSLLGGIPYVSTATVSLAYSDRDLPGPMQGFGVIVPRISQRRIMAVTFCSNKFSHRAPRDTTLMRVFVGGASNERLALQEDCDMLRMVTEELEDLLGIRAEPILQKVYRWEKAMPQYVVGHLERVARIEERLSSFPGLYLTGSAYKGIGISDCIERSREVAQRATELLVQAC